MAEVHGNRRSSENEEVLDDSKPDNTEYDTDQKNPIQSDPDLKSIVDSWTSIPDDIKSAIMVMVRAAKVERSN